VKTFYKIQLILFIISANAAFSQDTNIVKFFPLEIGNVWVYNGYKSTTSQCSTVYLKKISIDSTIVANNKTYYKFNITTSFIGGNGSCHYSYLYLGFYRIDSVSGNIYMLSSNPNCSFNPNEVLFDSLKSRVGDTTRICSGGSTFRKILNDTTQTQVFGFQKPSKNFRDANYLEYIAHCRFSKDFGVTYFDEYGMSIASQNWLKGCILNGVMYGDTNFYLVSLNPISSEIPKTFELFQNYPNPFNPITQIKFDVPKSSFINLTIYDAVGKEIGVLVNENLQAGSYSVDWDASTYPSGVYFYRITAGDYVQTKKMVLVK
jgi:hypothetical protein